MMKMKWMVALGSVVLLSVSACSKKSEGGSTAGSAAPATAAGGASPADAKKYFTEKCVVCHGDKGEGNGPGAAALNPKPRNFSDATWQGSVDDAHIKKVILGGGSAVGKSPIMPANPDLKGKDAMLDELVKYVRAMKK
ncbi:MAG: cytochrome c [Polyangiaceae bacterium]